MGAGRFGASVGARWGTCPQCPNVPQHCRLGASASVGATLKLEAETSELRWWKHLFLACELLLSLLVFRVRVCFTALLLTRHWHLVLECRYY